MHGIRVRGRREEVRVTRAMARPWDTKNKRKEVEVEVEGKLEHEQRFRASEKRSRLSTSWESVDVDVGEKEEDEANRSGWSLLGKVQRVLEARRRKSTRPLPALMGDKPVDLMVLHSRVSSMGGYKKVSEAGLWSAVADALGLGLECGPGLKLVYVKYLKALETGKFSSLTASQPSSSELRTHPVRPDCGASIWWEPGSASKEAEARHEYEENGVCAPVEAIELQNLIRRQAFGDTGRRRESGSGRGNAGVALSDEDAIGDLRGRHESQFECRQSSTSEDWATTYASVEHLARIPSDRGDEAYESDEGRSASYDWHEGESDELVQQQREALNGMVEWIKRIALNPGNPIAVLDSESSGQGDDWVYQCQMLTAKVRSVLWKEHRGGDSSMQAKPMPSLYYDEPDRPDSHALERLRATRERLVHYGFQPLPGLNHRGATSTYQDGNDGSYWGTSGAHAGQRTSRHSVNYNETAFARYNQQRKRIPVGQDFQAELVRWVGRDLLHKSSDTTQNKSAGEGLNSSDDEDNDDRWLGERVWPPVWPPVWPQPTRVGVDSSLKVGRGRAASCDCREPGSINCVRRHIGAARENLRNDLGAAFNQMGFDQMGESVADQWTKDDEHTFRLIARTHPASKSRNFWDYLPNVFPFKTRKELNSYYFNVFVLRRRAIQNRLCEIVDSDDDEGELPGESDDSSYASTDDDVEDDDDDDDLSDGANDAGSEDMLDAHPLKVPDDTHARNFTSLPVYYFSPREEVTLHEGDRPRTASSIVMNLDEADNHATHDQADSSHVTLVWDEKHLEAGSLVRDGVLPQARHWEEPHWDARDHQAVSSVVGGVLSSRQLSPLAGKEDTRQSTGLGDLWSQNMEMAPKQEKDRLLSTSGMILELFGDDVMKLVVYRGRHDYETRLRGRPIRLWRNLSQTLPSPRQHTYLADYDRLRYPSGPECGPQSRMQDMGANVHSAP